MESRKEKFKKVLIPVAELVVAASVTVACDGIIKKLAPDVDKTSKRVMIAIGSWCISNYIGTKVTEHTVDMLDDKIDQIDEQLKALKTSYAVIKGVK